MLSARHFFINVCVKDNSLIPQIYLIRHLTSTTQLKPSYPPIRDVSPEGNVRYARQQWYDSIQQMPTVEQKLYEITAKRGYFPRNYILSSCPNTYTAVPFIRYITRTHVIKGLPDNFEMLSIDENTYNDLKSDLYTTVLNHYSNKWREQRLATFSDYVSEKECGAKLFSDLLSLFCRRLAWRYPHFLDASYDSRPRMDSYWWHDDFKLDRKVAKKLEDGDNICFQFQDIAYYSVRCNKPLKQIVPLDDKLCSTPEVVDYNYHPKVCGIPYVRRYITSVPGFWPGVESDFPFLQVYTYDRLHEFLSGIEYYDLQEIEDSYGVMASFGWLNGIASYQGFTPFHDITYPIVGQTIVTNGQEWNFYVYQLNTITFHSDLDKKDRRNLCWSSGKMRLFETIENNELKGINDDVFKTFLKFMVNTPEIPEGINLKPYLGKDTRTDEEITETRTALRKLYRNAPDPKAHLWEIPMWQQVYKRHPDAPPTPQLRLQ